MIRKVLFSVLLGISTVSYESNAAETYAASLSAADAALGKGDADTALTELAAALAKATNGGEKGLALAKKGYVLAFIKQDLPGARAAVDESLKIEGLAPVAKVTALHVLAQCQMKADKNFSGAQASLIEAKALQGVDWAKPGIESSLGDCYRDLRQLDKALESYNALLGMANAGADLKAGANLNIGFIYQYDRKDFAKAKEYYAAAVSLQPTMKTEVDRHIASMASP